MQNDIRITLQSVASVLLAVSGLVAETKSTTYGVTASGKPLTAYVDRHSNDARFRVVVVGQSSECRELVEQARKLIGKTAGLSNYAFDWIDCSYTAAEAFPPNGTAYSTKNKAAFHLWRWLGMHAPDLIVELRPASELRGVRGTPTAVALLRNEVTQKTFIPEGELTRALGTDAPCGTGSIPALLFETNKDSLPVDLGPLLKQLSKTKLKDHSPARREIERRLKRTPTEIAQELSKVYGHDLKQVVYIPTLALVGRLRLAELTDANQHRDAVEKIVLPLKVGQRQSRVNSGSALSGHLIFSELAKRSSGSDRTRYIDLAKRAADLGLKNGKPAESMPFHVEMSDSLFMGGPILAQVGALTSDERYFDACIRHLRFMRKLDLRKDGLYRHSPLDEAAWGRGNGFPALGLALCLSDWPAKRKDFPAIKAMYVNHMRALATHQDNGGCWHQVIDRPDTYREFTCTCMITFAMMRGIERGWISRQEFGPNVERGWQAIKARVGKNGQLVDVCTGTGKQKSLRDYYHRKAILGKDARGGAMALMVSTERIKYERKVR